MPATALSRRSSAKVQIETPALTFANAPFPVPFTRGSIRGPYTVPTENHTPGLQDSTTREPLSERRRGMEGGKDDYTRTRVSTPKTNATPKKQTAALALQLKEEGRVQTSVGDLLGPGGCLSSQGLFCQTAGEARAKSLFAKHPQPTSKPIAAIASHRQPSPVPGARSAVLLSLCGFRDFSLASPFVIPSSPLAPSSSRLPVRGNLAPAAAAPSPGWRTDRENGKRKRGQARLRASRRPPGPLVQNAKAPEGDFGRQRLAGPGAGGTLRA